MRGERREEKTNSLKDPMKRPSKAWITRRPISKAGTEGEWVRVINTIKRIEHG